MKLIVQILNNTDLNVVLKTMIIKVVNIISLLSPLAKWHSPDLHLYKIEFPHQRMHFVKFDPGWPSGS